MRTSCSPVALSPAARSLLRSGSAPVLFLTCLLGCGGGEPQAPATAEQVDEAPATGMTTVDGQTHMRALLQRISVQSAQDHPWLESRTAEQLRARLAQLTADSPVRQRWNVNHRLGVAELQLGNEVEALQHLEAAHALLPELAGRIPPEAYESTILDLGVAYLRFGETRNCCLRYNGESCIMPLQGGGLHTDPEGSTKAAACFIELIGNPQATTINVLTAKWLLNVANMTLGTWPDGVPAALRLPSSVLQSKVDFPRFKNVLPELGLDTFDLAGGVVVDDFDGDGYLDVVTSTWDTSGSMRYFHNERDGSFTDRTASAGLDHYFGGLNLIQADYDNDGDLDLYVLRGAWMGQLGCHPNSLLRNNGDNTFTDMTFEAGLGEPFYPTKTGAWADYDLDGDLDLYVGNETSGRDEKLDIFLGSKTTGVLDAPSQLFRNNGDGTFTDVAQDAGLKDRIFVMGASWGDYDKDGDPDLYVSAMGPNKLYRNNGDGTFVDVAEELGVTDTLASFPTWFWDFDNDGNLDIYVSASSGPVSVLALFPEGLDVNDENPAVHKLQDWARTWVQLPSLYRGDGQGGFKEIAREQGLTELTLPMGANFGDLDGDGFQDFYLSTGSFLYSDLQPSLMFKNRRGQGFDNVTMAGGFGHLQKGHGVAFADIDNDGDMDVYAQMGGAAPGDKFNDALFLNPGFGTHWLGVELRGVASNRFGVGTRLRAEFVEDGVTRSVYKHVNSGGSFGSSPLRQTLGLGRCEGPLSVLEVYWPRTGVTQRFENVPTDHVIRITEGSDEYVRIELEPLVLSGRK